MLYKAGLVSFEEHG